MEENLITKNDLLKKLRAFMDTPNDDNILYKQKIKNALISNPCLLYAINEKKLESELFDADGNINWELNDETGIYEPLGEWDRYFGESSNIRPFLFIPETQTTVKHYICYQAAFNETPRYNAIEKYMNITFTIFVHGDDSIDKLTGIPRHDLIASILRERIQWSNIFGTQCRLVSDRESVTDTNYLVRTLVFECTILNSISQTHNSKTSVINNKVKV